VPVASLRMSQTIPIRVGAMGSNQASQSVTVVQIILIFLTDVCLYECPLL